MKLYLVSQDINKGYDTYDSVVVSAENEEDAKTVMSFCKYSWVEENDKNKLQVEYLGEYVGDERKIILASFNAG